jgi:hypothetical protein
MEIGPPRHYKDEYIKAVESKVYVTTDIRIASRYGEVYLVEPIGRLELDDSYDEGETETVFACDRARILARVSVPDCVRAAWLLPKPEEAKVVALPPSRSA